MDKHPLIVNHDGGLRRLLIIYNQNGALWKGPLLITSIFFDTVLILGLYSFTPDLFKFLSDVTDLYITVLPSLLGFNLGAYALLIGLASTDLLGNLSRAEVKKYSTFQRASSVFGFCVLLQAVALIVAFAYKLEISIADEIIPHLALKTANIINLVGIFILNAFGFYSIFSLIAVIRAVFSISQAAHFFSVTGHIIKQSNDTVNNDANPAP